VKLRIVLDSQQNYETISITQSVTRDRRMIMKFMERNLNIEFLGICALPTGEFTIKEFLAANHATITRELQANCQKFFNNETTLGNCVKGKRGNQSTYSYSEVVETRDAAEDAEFLANAAAIGCPINVEDAVDAGLNVKAVEQTLAPFFDYVPGTPVTAEERVVEKKVRGVIGENVWRCIQEAIGWGIIVSKDRTGGQDHYIYGVKFSSLLLLEGFLCRNLDRFHELCVDLAVRVHGDRERFAEIQADIERAKAEVA
jgi:hypothetical protein